MRRLLPLALVVFACNDHPLTPIEQSVSGAVQLVDVQPDKAQLDFLFVIDNSGSMCQEQANLARNFGAFSDFLFETLGEAADYRVAVTSTDLVTHRGAFLAQPADPVPARECVDPTTGEAGVPNTADCFGAPLDPILSSAEGLDRDELARRFRCLATLGTGGNNQEKGLEAMRLALSCTGPNAADFGECCEGGAYDPGCAPVEDPRFLRPDATLVVVFVSDEDDCSDPNENPAASSRAICKYGPADGDLDGTPDGYRDAALCDALAPGACFVRDCGADDAEDCFARCTVEAELNACEWTRRDLVPEGEYVRFLNSLKADPLRQLLVASIVGGQVRTPEGHPVAYNPGVPAPDCDGDVRTGSGRYDSLAPSDACCPGGACLGPKQPSCASANGEAFAGRRYLAVAGAFGRNGIGCRPEDEGTPACVDICADDFATPLAQVQAGLRGLLALHCLDAPPACQVYEDGELRACAEAERANPDNYDVRVRVDCPWDAEDAACAAFAGPPAAARAAWDFVPTDPRCGGGAAVEMALIPPPGAAVQIDYSVQVGAGT